LENRGRAVLRQFRFDTAPSQGLGGSLPPKVAEVYTEALLATICLPRNGTGETVLFVGRISLFSDYMVSHGI
ncbi:MAG: hypothetical protein LUG57_08215, partial [Oscillospiraceae bacterium]|nr:hypothetical protein [Oscillospiraceae bacterium]